MPLFDLTVPDACPNNTSSSPLQEELGGAVGGKGKGVMGSITLNSVMQILPYLELSASSVVLDAGSGTGR